MKSLLRSGFASSLLGYAIWCWMVLIARTTRWNIEGAERFSALWHGEDGMIVAGWHSRILLLPSGWSWIRKHLPFEQKSTAMLISLSSDGEFVAKAIRHLGLVAIRGSKTHKRKAKDKGGVRAIAQTVRHLKAGDVVCVTPDGPRGPREEVSPGPIILAQRAGIPIVPYGLAVSGGRTLNTWDRFLIPLPFGRGGIVFGDPITVPPDARPEDIQQRVQTGMDAANRRAHMLAGRPLETPAPAKSSAKTSA
ncbi:MAG: lysophospholipid acyltransferase family protein [Pseudomonadota bacterium]